MLFDVVVKIGESLNQLQILNGDSDFIVVLYQGDEIYQVDTVKAECLFQVRIR